MKSRELFQKTLYPIKTIALIFFVFLFQLGSLKIQAQSNLKEAFLPPGLNAKPWVYWYWNNGNITSEGIKADIRGFQDIGIGGLIVMDIGRGPRGEIKNRSGEWYQLFRLAVSEAKKRGIKISIGGSPGWSSSGGPWITPEMSMKILTWTELRVNGSNNEPIILEQPHTNLNYYNEIAMLAFPSPKEDTWLLKDLNPKVISEKGEIIRDADLLFDQDYKTTVDLPKQFHLVFDKPISVRSVAIIAKNMFKATIEAWDASLGEFVRIAKFQTNETGPFTEKFGDTTFPKYTSDKFRIKMNPQSVGEIAFSGGYRINNWPAKSGIGIYDNTNPANTLTIYNDADEGDIIPIDAIINLTDKLEPGGILNWDVPEGEWTIMRFGYTSNGVEIYPAPYGGKGLECDKLSKEGTRFNYKYAIKPILGILGEDLIGGIDCHHIDSYEAGWQNWTQSFQQEFNTRCGYDIIKHLPSLSGRVIDEEQKTEEFLWDFRHTISDLFIDNHFGNAAEISHRDGLMFSNEPYNGPFNGLKAGSKADYPMIEFWFPDTQPLKNRMRFHSVFAGRINNRKIIGAEAFTSAVPKVRWNEHPYMLKASGDFMYCSGVNRFVIHVSTHQPYIGQQFAPGYTISDLGTHFDRYNTWWEHGAKEYMEYLTRCQSLLQQGEHLADVLYFIGGESPFNDTWHNNWGVKEYLPELPYGYDFDACSEDVLLNLQVKNNLMQFPFGKNYKYLVLPVHGKVTTALLKKVMALVKDGATVVGSPVNFETPSLSDEIKYDKGERIRLIHELWGKASTAKGERKVGKGRVIWGTDFQTILSEDKLIPDFSYNTSEDLLINSTHRYTDDEEIYFVANGKQNPGWALCRFRISGKVPQLWDPYTGILKACKVYKANEDYIEIPIYFDPAGSVFVIFKEDKDENNFTSLTKDGVDITKGEKLYVDLIEGGDKALIRETGVYEFTKKNGRSNSFTVSNIASPIKFTEPWQVTFPKGWGAPEKIRFPELISYTEHTDEGIKYFSGTATYNTIINVPDNVLGDDQAVFLELGRVEVIAEVIVNRKNLGTFWKPPFCIDVTSAIIAGENKIEIKVTNLWPNRMIGDEQYPADYKVFPEIELPDWVLDNEQRPDPRRKTFTTYPSWKKDDTLLPSGLIGPVRLKFAKIKLIKQ